jgi:hypothetical protein
MAKQKASGVPLPLENAAEDYIKYAKALEKEYSDVLEVCALVTQRGLPFPSQLGYRACERAQDPSMQL